MKNVICAILLLFGIQGLSAQSVPGYMGKKISLTANGQVMASLGSIFNNKIAFCPSFSASYAIGRHSELGVTYEAFSRQVVFTDYSNPLLDEEVPTEIGIKFSSATLFYSMFTRNGLAPLGPHYVFGAGKIWASPVGEISDEIRGTENSGPIEKYDYFVLSTGFFRKDILWGPVYINYGVQLNCTFAFKYGAGLNIFNFSTDTYYADHENANPLIVYDELKSLNIIAVKLGIGILI